MTKTKTENDLVAILLRELVEVKARAESSAIIAREALSKAEEALIAVRAAKESTHTVSYVNPQEMEKVRQEVQALTDEQLDEELNGDVFEAVDDFEVLSNAGNKLRSRPDGKGR